MAKSYFAILGVTPDASTEEIHSAYRQLAKAYHPDRFRGGSATFIQIQEAYTVLSDPHQRKGYEQSMRPSAARPIPTPAYDLPPEPLIPTQAPMDLGPISPVRSFRTFNPSLDEIFERLWRAPHSEERPKSGRLSHLTLEVPLTRDQARRGGQATVMVPVRSICPDCRGSGHYGFFTCRRCDGAGAVVTERAVGVSFPAGLMRDYAVVLGLDRLGIRHLTITVLFRPGDR